MDVALLVCARLRVELHVGLCVGLHIFVEASGRIELLWNFYWRQGGPDLPGRSALERVQALFLIERDGEQDGFHRVVARLIRGRLRVGAHAAKQAVEIFLILAAQRAAELRPSRDGVVDQLPECGNRAAHGCP